MDNQTQRYFLTCYHPTRVDSICSVFSPATLIPCPAPYLVNSGRFLCAHGRLWGYVVCCRVIMLRMYMEVYAGRQDSVSE